MPELKTIIEANNLPFKIKQIALHLGKTNSYFEGISSRNLPDEAGIHWNKHVYKRKNFIFTYGVRESSGTEDVRYCQLEQKLGWSKPQKLVLYHNRLLEDNSLSGTVSSDIEDYVPLINQVYDNLLQIKARRINFGRNTKKMAEMESIDSSVHGLEI